MNRLASLCMQFATWLMRHERGDWARAMRSELLFVNEPERLSWAFGCVIAAIKQRLVPMDTGNFRISRWVMLVETLGCFGPLTFGWLLFNFHQPGVLLRPIQLINAAYLPQDGGVFLAWMVIAGAIVGLVGPIGLYLGLRYVVSGHPLRSRALGGALIGAPILLTIVGTITGMLFGPSDFKPHLDVTFVFVMLPVFGFIHLMYLARPSARPPMLVTA